MAVYTRLSDGAVLDYSTVSDSFDRIIGIYNFNRSPEFSYSENAQAREIAEYIQQKTFTIELVMTDTAGEDQLEAMDFFKKSGKYSVTGPEFSLETMNFWVVSFDENFFQGKTDTISMTCQAEFGDFMEENVVPIHSRLVPSGAYSGWSGTYTNTSGVDQTIRLQISKNDPTTPFIANTSTRLLKGSAGIAITLGGFSMLGELENRAGRQIIVDSWSEIIDGYAVISPMSASFFKMKPGETATLSLEAFSAAPTAGAYFVGVTAYSVKRRAA